MNASARVHAIRILLLLTIKVGLFVVLVRDCYLLEHIGRWSLRDGDTWEYIDPGESLLANGTYAPDHRMPGYTLPWLGLRSMISYEHAADAIVILQLLFSALAIYALAWMLYRTTGSRWVFWATLLLLGFGTYFSRYETFVMNESFTTSALTLHWVFFLLWRRDRRKRWLVLGGLMIAWAVFMRPIYAPLLAVLPLFLLFEHGRNWRQRFSAATILLLPFLFADVPWMARNYQAHHAVHPLTNGVYGPTFSVSPYYAAIKMLQSYGGNYNFWDPKADIRWFGFRERPREGIAALENDYPPPPAIALIPGYTMDSLAGFGKLLMQAKDVTRPQAEQDSLAAAAHRWADTYRAAYAQARPFQYHVMARLRMLRHLLVHSGSSSLFASPWSTLSWPKRLFKLAQSALYLFTMGFGGLMAVWLVVRRRTSPEFRVLGVLVLYGILAHPFLMRVCEIRYLAPTFPLTEVAAILLVYGLSRKHPSAT